MSIAHGTLMIDKSATSCFEFTILNFLKFCLHRDILASDTTLHCKLDPGRELRQKRKVSRFKHRKDGTLQQL